MNKIDKHNALLHVLATVTTKKQWMEVLFDLETLEDSMLQSEIDESYARG